MLPMPRRLAAIDLGSETAEPIELASRPAHGCRHGDRPLELLPAEGTA